MSDTDTNEPQVVPPGADWSQYNKPFGAVNPPPRLDFNLTRDLGNLLSAARAAFAPQQPYQNPPYRPPVPLPNSQTPKPGEAPFSDPSVVRRGPNDPPQPQPQPQPQPPAAAQPGATKVAAAGWPLPQPAQGFQRFKKNSTRGVDEWAKPWWPIESVKHNPEIVRTSHMPAPSESYRELADAGRKLATYSAPAVAGPASVVGSIALSIDKMLGPVMDYYGGGAFSKGFGKSQAHAIANQMAEMKMNTQQYELKRQQMLDAADDAQEAHKLMMMDYKSIFKRYQLGDLNEEEANDEIRNLNQKYRHQNLDNMLTNQGMGAVERYLDSEDAWIRDLESGNASLRASDRRRKKEAGLSEDTDLDKEWGDGTDVRGGAIPGQRPLPFRGPDAAAAAGAAHSPTAGGESVDPNDPTYDIAKRNNLSKSGMEAARELLQDGTVRGLTPTQAGKMAPRKYDNVVTAAGEMGARINDIAANREMSPQEKLDKMREISPVIADAVDGLRNYTVNPVSLGKMRGIGTRLASQVDPNYKEGFYQIAQKYRDPNTKEGQVMSRTATLPIAALSVLNALKDMSETDKIPKRVIESFGAEYYTGDPKYAQLYSALRMFATDAVAVSMGSGTPRVTLVNDLIKHMAASGSPAQIRTQLLTDLRTSFSYIHNVDEQWRTETGQSRHAPGFAPHNYNMLDSMLRMNPYTGQVPKDAPDILKGVGRSKPETRPSWMKEGQDWEPMTRAQVDGARRWLHDNPDDPRAQAIREQMGLVP
jgi:hypothetical protein